MTAAFQGRREPAGTIVSTFVDYVSICFPQMAR
jgi:hypothetical protein